MLSNRLAFAAVSVACVAAAGGGGYLATRQSQAGSAIAAPAPQAAAAPAVAAAPPSTHPIVEPAAAAAPAKLVEATSRVAAAAPAAVASKTPRKDPGAISARNAATPTVAASPAASVPQNSAAPLLTPVPAPDTTAARQDDVRALDPPRTSEPEKAPERTFDELVVSADSVIGLQLETALSTEHARVEDRVDARVIRDVRVRNQVAIPAGSHAMGSVMVVESGGKFKEKARLGIRFNTLVLPDGTRLPVSTETIYREGEPPSNKSAAKIGGGAVIGTILGGILGGAKGAAVGAAAGAGGGAAAVASGDRSAVTLPAGTQMTARFLSPVTVTVEK